MITKEQYEELVGTKVGDFIVEKYISHGGQAVIFKVKSFKFQRPIALKIFGLASMADNKAIDNGIRDLQASILDHKSVIKYYPPGQDIIDFIGKPHKVLYIPMDYTDLGSCEDSPFNKEAPLREVDYKSIISLLEGLREIHKVQIIHEDLKPANILKFADNDNGENFITMKITDFGISKVSSDFGLGPNGVSGAVQPPFVTPLR